MSLSWLMDFSCSLSATSWREREREIDGQGFQINGRLKTDLKVKCHTPGVKCHTLGVKCHTPGVDRNVTLAIGLSLWLLEPMTYIINTSLVGTSRHTVTLQD